MKPFYKNNLENLELIDQLRKINPNLFTEISLRRKNAQSYEFISDLIDFSIFTQTTQAAQDYQKKWINSILLAYRYFSLEKIKKEIDQDENQDKTIKDKIAQFLKMGYGEIASLSYEKSFDILNFLDQVQNKYKKSNDYDNYCNALVNAFVNKIKNPQISSNNQEDIINLERINNLIENVFYNNLGFVTLISNIEKANASNGIDVVPVAVTEINQEQLMTGSIEAKELLVESIIDQENPMDSSLIAGAVEAAPLKSIKRDRGAILTERQKTSRFVEKSLDINKSQKLSEEILMDEIQNPVQKAGSVTTVLVISGITGGLIIFLTNTPNQQQKSKEAQKYLPKKLLGNLEQNMANNEEIMVF